MRLGHFELFSGKGAVELVDVVFLAPCLVLGELLEGIVYVEFACSEEASVREISEYECQSHCRMFKGKRERDEQESSVAMRRLADAFLRGRVDASLGTLCLELLESGFLLL